ncbi:uncharacterized protein DDB_G0284459-like [Anabrus simplex]|uniref:uncharacterized protein DDB_G0284459-like n=1 Tax=Anabrus simplex TaxID=316456 RepID=UPI0035A31F6F
MQTSPCGHRVVCRKCFVKTIQMAVSQRLLPLRCVICRAKILRLKQNGGSGVGGVLLPSSASHYSVPAGGSGKWAASGYSVGGGKWAVPSSASQYSMGGSVPNSASLYSMSSGSSSLSGVSSVSSATNSSQSSSKSVKSNSASRLPGFPRQPTGSLRRSQAQAMKLRIQEYKEPVRTGREPLEKTGRLPPIKEFQREFRAGKERTASSSSTRIRCAQKIVTQLETTPLIKTSSSNYFRSPLRPANKEDKRKADKRREDKRDNEENLENKRKEEKMKKADKKESKADKKADKKEEKKDAKVEKKDCKSEKKESKKEAKAEKKESKKEAKAEKKKEKKEGKLEKKEKE